MLGDRSILLVPMDLSSTMSQGTTLAFLGVFSAVEPRSRWPIRSLKPEGEDSVKCIFLKRLIAIAIHGIKR
jgi:hypothetical protein